MNQPNAFVRFLNTYFSWLSIPYLPIILASIPVLGLLLEGMGYPAHYYMFDADLIRGGEYWRLLALSAGMKNILFLIIYVMFTHYVVDAIENEWGENTLSLYVVFSYFAAVAAGLWLSPYINIWYYVTLNASLAFGTLFPNAEIYMYFIIKVKAKWLAILAGVMIAYQFLTSGMAQRLTLLMVLLPYVLFLGTDVLKQQWQWVLQKRRQRDFFQS